MFHGGCITYEFEFDDGQTASLLFEADAALAMQPRGPLVDEVRSTTDGLSLCGSGAPPCADGGD